MNTSMNEIHLNFITKDVVQHFKFLFDKGFRINDASGFLQSFGNWFVEFEYQNCFLVIFRDRNQITIGIYPDKANKKIVIDLKVMIYLLSNGRTFIGIYEGNKAWGTKNQLKEISNLLKKYIDQILPLITYREFENIMDDYKLAFKGYLAIQQAEYQNKHRRF